MDLPYGWRGQVHSAAHDLRFKLLLERRFRPILRNYNNMILREFRRQFLLTGTALTVAQFDDQLGDILRAHYDRVLDVFSDRLSPAMPLDVAVTEGERDVIAEALSIWMIGHAALQTEVINTTTQEQAIESIQLANDDELVRVETGQAARLTAAALALALLKRRLAAREESILITETQIAAETAKATEAEVLTGHPPSITGGAAFVSIVRKEWVSVADSRVRPAHLSGDGQKRLLTVPYNIGGEQLRWPGDRGLGASAGNVINCRCASVVSTTQIIEVRRGA